MSALVLIGAAGIGAPGGWSAMRATGWRPRLVVAFLAASALPLTALALASTTAAAACLGGVLAGAALRASLDFVLMYRTTSKGRH